MDWSFLTNGLGFAVELCLPFIGGILVASLLVGAFQVATQISDEGISFSGKLAAGVIVFLVAGGSILSRLTEFTERIWGGADLYF